MACFVYKPERLTAYELGTKNVFSNLTFNASAFYYDYKDQQTSSLVTRGNIARAIEVNSSLTDRDRAGDVLFTFNIPTSEVKGIQLESSLELPGNINLSINTLYLDAEITSDAEVIDKPFLAGAQFLLAVTLTM